MHSRGGTARPRLDHRVVRDRLARARRTRSSAAARRADSRWSTGVVFGGTAGHSRDRAPPLAPPARDRGRRERSWRSTLLFSLAGTPGTCASPAGHARRADASSLPAVTARTSNGPVDVARTRRGGRATLAFLRGAERAAWRLLTRTGASWWSRGSAHRASHRILTIALIAFSTAVVARLTSTHSDHCPDLVLDRPGRGGAAGRHPGIRAQRAGRLDPRAGETLTELPDAVQRHDERAAARGPGSSGFALQIRDAAGAYYGDGCVEVVDATMSAIPALGAPGEYTMLWQAVSADGHSIDGEIPFTWAPGRRRRRRRGLGDAAGVRSGRDRRHRAPTASATAAAE